MPFRPGERLRCSNPECQLQVIVTDLGIGKSTETLPRCACGFPMKKYYEKPRVTRVKLVRDASTTA